MHVVRRKIYAQHNANKLMIVKRKVLKLIWSFIGSLSYDLFFMAEKELC